MNNTKGKTAVKSIRVLSERSIICRTQKDREIRDLYNQLCKKYRYYVVLEWFERNYFIQEYTLMQMIKRSDNKPVDISRASITYLTAIKPEFQL